MEEKIINRLFAYLKRKNIPHTRFEKEIGLSNGYLKTQERRKSDLGEGVISKIIDNCLDINIIWLMTGKGDMFRADKDLAITQSVQGNNNVAIGHNDGSSINMNELPNNDKQSTLLLEEYKERLKKQDTYIKELQEERKLLYAQISKLIDKLK